LMKVQGSLNGLILIVFESCVEKAFL